MLLRFINGTAQSSGQRLDNVNQTHLVLASGKLVLPKNNPKPCYLVDILSSFTDFEFRGNYSISWLMDFHDPICKWKWKIPLELE